MFSTPAGIGLVAIAAIQTSGKGKINRFDNYMTENRTKLVSISMYSMHCMFQVVVVTPG